MKNLKKFNDFIYESFLDSSEFFGKLGSLINSTLSTSVNSEDYANNVEKGDMPEPGGAPAESPQGKGIPLEKNADLSSSEMDSFGEKIGISDKSDNGKLNQPARGPIGNLLNSAYANLNVSTRKIPATDGGKLGCAAATSIMFYRATGYSLAGNTPICIGTLTVYDELDAKSKEPMSAWKKITDWKTNYQPGDIIITRRRTRAGHVGIVVNKGKIISNSSSGFKGDKLGQIEENYTISSWEKDVAKRNPTETTIFRYQGPYKTSWS
jgi:hypothetical protein